MIHINTYMAKCLPSGFSQEIDQLMSDIFFNINDDEELMKCKKVFEEGHLTYTLGYIEVSCDNQVYFGKKYQDYIVSLWSEILACIGELIFEKKSVKVLFPGQPLQFFFDPKKNFLVMELRNSEKILEQIKVPKNQFLISFVQNGLIFMKNIEKVKPTDNIRLMIRNCNEYLKYLNPN